MTLDDWGAFVDEWDVFIDELRLLLRRTPEFPGATRQDRVAEFLARLSRACDVLWDMIDNARAMVEAASQQLEVPADPRALLPRARWALLRDFWSASVSDLRRSTTSVLGWADLCLMIGGDDLSASVRTDLHQLRAVAQTFSRRLDEHRSGYWPAWAAVLSLYDDQPGEPDA